MMKNNKIAVILPSYQTKKQIAMVIAAIPSYVDKIYVVDDACPQETGKFVKAEIKDKRVKILFLEKNQGVGGATLAGMKQAVLDGADIIAKLDSDGQHDPKILDSLILPLLEGTADFVKGNRFFFLENLTQMPKIRLFGNAILSFFSKFSSGYWNLFDPTNGFIVMQSDVFKALPINKIDSRYFFESDLLFRLYTIEAKIVEIPMSAVYNDEESGLQPSRVVGLFLWKHLKNAVKRIFYSYFLRNFSIVSIYLVFGLLFLLFGFAIGIITWLQHFGTGQGAPFGMVMFPGILILVGMQMLIGFFANDIASVPQRPIHPILRLLKRRNPTDEKDKEE